MYTEIYNCFFTSHNDSCLSSYPRPSPAVVYFVSFVKHLIIIFYVQYSGPETFINRS